VNEGGNVRNAEFDVVSIGMRSDRMGGKVQKVEFEVSMF